MHCTFSQGDGAIIVVPVSILNQILEDSNVLTTEIALLERNLGAEIQELDKKYDALQQKQLELKKKLNFLKSFA